MGASGAAWAAGKGPAILTRPIPSTGATIPVVGLGTWQTFDVGVGPAQRALLAEVLATFVELGGQLVDSSPKGRRARELAFDGAPKDVARLFVGSLEGAMLIARSW